MRNTILYIVVSLLFINTFGVSINNTQDEHTYLVVEEYYQANDEDDGGTRG